MSSHFLRRDLNNINDKMMYSKWVAYSKPSTKILYNMAHCQSKREKYLKALRKKLSNKSIRFLDGYV